MVSNVEARFLVSNRGARSGIRGSSIVILDEAHECSPQLRARVQNAELQNGKCFAVLVYLHLRRSIHTDVLLGLVKKAFWPSSHHSLTIIDKHDSSFKGVGAR